MTEHEKNVPATDVYVAAIPTDLQPKTVYPPQRQMEIDACKHERVRAEKYCVWKLLEHAVEHSLGIPFRALHFEKNGNGKWTSDACFFSLSHSHGVVAVAISHAPVGIDVELADGIRLEGLYRRILTEREVRVFLSLPQEERPLFLIEKWTGKESIFKSSNESVFHPEQTDAENVQTGHFERDGRQYVFSVAGECGEVRLHMNDTVAF